MSRHVRRPAASRPFDNAGSVGRCHICGMLSFLSKDAAKRNGRQSQRNGVAVSRAFKCESGYWHNSAQDAATVTEYREAGQ
jgi:hypothetical protein